MDRTTGIWKTLRTSEETYQAYIPHPLPPVPALDLTKLTPLLEKAMYNIGKLDGLSDLLPNVTLFLYQYVRKEAVLSSQIEGAQSSLSDLLLHELDEAPGVPFEDVVEVSCYVSAIEYGRQRLETLPLSLRLLQEIHEKLLSHGRGQHQQPGQFRRSQNWIGGTRPGNAMFIPPPPDALMPCLDAFEKFLHTTDLPLLVKAGLAHVQFETIHPFLDGNGRLGRLLITLMLCDSGLLKDPTLYLSLYFKTHRAQYYNLLTLVRETGNWEAWLEFFLTGVAETADNALQAVPRLQKLFLKDKQQLTGRWAANAYRALDVLQNRPIITVASLSLALGISAPTARSVLEHLSELGILRELTGRKRDKVYAYDAYIQILSEGTEPLPR